MGDIDGSPAARCEALRGLHVPGRPLVLPNAWDVASARAVVEAGFPAVATSSGAIAVSLGFEDHEGAPGDVMLEAAARIAARVPVPVTVDAERGYGWAPAELVARLQAAGAAGANLEDTDHRRGAPVPLDEQVAWLREVRRAAGALGYPLVVNARVDVFIANRGKDQLPLVDEALERAHAYVAAGADCVYPIFLTAPDARQRFLAAAPGPVNLLTWPGGAPVSELAAAGAARVSYGSTIHRLTQSALAAELGRIAADA